MPNELITLQFGQCGNQIGSAFWHALCAEHAIAPDGTLAHDDKGVRDLKRVFFSQVINPAIFSHLFRLVSHCLLPDYSVVLCFSVKEKCSLKSFVIGRRFALCSSRCPG